MWDFHPAPRGDLLEVNCGGLLTGHKQGGLSSASPEIKVAVACKMQLTTTRYINQTTSTKSRGFISEEFLLLLLLLAWLFGRRAT